MKNGGELAGSTVAAGRAVVVSEEAPEHWHRRARLLDLGDHVGWYCRPFRDRPRPADWLALLDRIAETHAARPLALVVIDPLAAFLPAAFLTLDRILERVTWPRFVAAIAVWAGMLLRGHPETVAKNPEFLNLFGIQDLKDIGFYSHHHNHQHD